MTFGHQLATLAIASSFSREPKGSARRWTCLPLSQVSGQRKLRQTFLATVAKPTVVALR